MRTCISDSCNAHRLRFMLPRSVSPPPCRDKHSRQRWQVCHSERCPAMDCYVLWVAMWFTKRIPQPQAVTGMGRAHRSSTVVSMVKHRCTARSLSKPCQRPGCKGPRDGPNTHDVCAASDLYLQAELCHHTRLACDWNSWTGTHVSSLSATLTDQPGVSALVPLQPGPW